jgi:hypothetical protein
MLGDKHGEFSDTPGKPALPVRVSGFPAVLLTADPARGMKTPNSEPDGRTRKT